MQKSIFVCTAVFLMVLTIGCSHGSTETLTVPTQPHSSIVSETVVSATEQIISGNETPQNLKPNVENPQNNSPSNSPSSAASDNIRAVPFNAGVYLSDIEFVFIY